MTDKPKRLEDVTITFNIEPWLEPDVEAMREAIQKAVIHVMHEAFAFDAVPTWDRVHEVYADELAKIAEEQAKPALPLAEWCGLDDALGRRADDIEQAKGSTLDKLAALVCIERKPGEQDDSLRRRWLEERAGFDPLGLGPDLPSEYEEPEVQWQTITFKSHDQWGRPREEELDVPKDAVVTAELRPPGPVMMTRYRITATPGTPFKPSGPILPSSMTKETTMNITWTTGPDKRTARLGDREARLVKVGDSWYAEGLIDLQWNAKSLGASRDVVELKRAAEAWIKGDESWDEHQRDRGFIAVYDENQADAKEWEMTQKALDTLCQSAKK